jgi:hypothetical protein
MHYAARKICAFPSFGDRLRPSLYFFSLIRLTCKVFIFLLER